ncbi:hypothetical protein PVBG_05987 [Plasmodium vivax Brazil I]|uniref:Variable surface protein n=1 Tax=Plasmodium vivax (strain Brazil I) TaxID=1033975 RepID=A0A0J9T2Z0_PLAV1|nr:hypothetical protein PVBG_05987 [Plasmodium vivax Brazil I]
MISLSNYYQGINLKFTTFLKTSLFIFLIWTYITYRDMGIFPKSLENKYAYGNILNINHHRLLAKHELHRKLGYTGTGAQLLRDSIGKNKEKVTDNISISSQLNNKGSNNFDTYMENYKRRYEKKKGLSKLDCYCEKKVFDKLNYIHSLSDKMRNDKKGFKKKILKKYGKVFIILTLIPALGIIYHIFLGFGKKLRFVLKFCLVEEHYKSMKHTQVGCNDLDLKLWESTLKNIKILYLIFIFTVITIFLLLFIYILTKIIKYEKLKAGKGKMNRKEYICFCKEFFNIN